MVLIPAGLSRDQLEISLHRLNPEYSYRWIDDSNYEWRGPGDKPADETIQAAWDEYEQEQIILVAAEDADAQDRSQLQNLDDILEAYIDNTGPSNAQTVVAIKALCRFSRYVIRRGIRKGWL